MKPIKIVTFAGLFACALPAYAATYGATARADVINRAGDIIGTAALTQGETGVLIRVKVAGLAPGPHGLHLHAHGACDPRDGFQTAKGHSGTGDKGEGLLNPSGPKPGDIPNIYVGADGIGQMEAYATEVVLSDTNGAAFIIHAFTDDHTSRPIGGADGRVACGVIETAQ